MKVKFEISEAIQAYHTFEIQCGSKEEAEEALNKIGESVSADDLLYELQSIFGSENVVNDGIYRTDNVEPAGTYEFLGWEE